MVDLSRMSRRELLVRGGVTAAGLALLQDDALAALMDISVQEEVIPWLDRPPTAPVSDVNVLDWEALDSWITPTDKLFRVGHYGRPVIEERDWNLEISGLVQRPRSFTLPELRARRRRDVVFTLECAGNRGFSGFMGAVHNARWTGTPLASILEEAGVLSSGIEVVFWGSDEGEEEIRGNTITQNFARSMSIQDAMDSNLLLCYEVNGEPLPNAHGFPLRLIAPGWYGIANVKWLTRIEVRATRFMGRFMARDYVTLRQEEVGGESMWVETSVGRSRVNSVPARVTRSGGRYRIHGAAWGTAIERVEVHVDDGPWRLAILGEGQDSPYTWTHWHLDWNDSVPGEHTIISRATDIEGKVQPAPTDPAIANKRTYWESNGQVTRRIRTG
ncbi:MAG: sulfite oxidase [Gemmatimonadota bacterium]|nr:sulfite oxidase [Gemmatimonadota bacterium]